MLKPYQLIMLILVSIFLIIISYLLIDQHLVWFLVKHDSSKYWLLKIFCNDTVLTIKIFVFFFYVYYFIKTINNKTNKFDRKLLLCGNAVVIGQFLKNILKIIFARYWPSTFICNNPSLISNNAYGFTWFKDNFNQSFPSGHTTLVFSFSISMCFLFPKLRWLWMLLAILVILGEVGLYYHFVSDVIAGILLGSLTGFYCAHEYNHQPESSPS